MVSFVCAQNSDRPRPTHDYSYGKPLQAQNDSVSYYEHMLIMGNFREIMCFVMVIRYLFNIQIF